MPTNIENVKHGIIENNLNSIPKTSSELSSAQSTNNDQNEHIKKGDDSSSIQSEIKENNTQANYWAYFSNITAMKNSFTWVSHISTHLTSILKNTVPQFKWIGVSMSGISAIVQSGYFILNIKKRKNEINNRDCIDPRKDPVLEELLPLTEGSIKIFKQNLHLDFDTDFNKELEHKSNQLLKAECIGEIIAVALMMSSNLLNAFSNDEEQDQTINFISIGLGIAASLAHLLAYQNVARLYGNLKEDTEEKAKDVKKQYAYFYNAIVNYCYNRNNDIYYKISNKSATTAEVENFYKEFFDELDKKFKNIKKANNFRNNPDKQQEYKFKLKDLVNALNQNKPLTLLKFKETSSVRSTTLLDELKSSSISSEETIKQFITMVEQQRNNQEYTSRVGV